MTKPLLSTLIGKAARLIPVLHVENPEHAVPLAEALVSAGVVALEVTLRTAAGPEVISRMRKAVPQAIVGAGTVTKPEHFAMVRDAGAQFAVSPALTERLAEGAATVDLPLIPGAVTPSEMLAAHELGFHELKFFPADLMGGTAMLKHVLPLYPDLSFCPTGGISDANATSYLDLANCFATGGAWLATREAIEAADWTGIHQRALKSVAVVTRS
jgi:2-dehydro-3-deoxyphosphogluconate aldolase/(4S)-4-hydroxy-2-oxoglutarate aldolase